MSQPENDPGVSAEDFAAVDAMVDWDFAVRTASYLVRPGPEIGRDEAHQVVGQLREFAMVSTGHVASTTGLHATPGEGVLIVDRPGWVQANVEAFRTVLAPAVGAAQRRRQRTPSAMANAMTTAIGGRITGAEVGSLLSFLSTRVLGQYDIARDPGRLLLVAPNVVQVERELEVDPDDFRLWVCLHEETHRVQFTANPWLRNHLLEGSRGLAVDLLGDPGQLGDRLVAAARNLPDVLRGGDGTGLLELIQTPEQREALAGLTAAMSLLEGHADVVMDEVGPQVIPSVAVIRKRFTSRRAGRGAVDRLLRRLLGLDAKMRQYADGAAFVRGVVKKVGMEGFNAVWSSPETLPRAAEISDPGAWVRRVHG
jgi:coenzyme F420 biosynthesis associated uncharacterized protein